MDKLRKCLDMKRKRRTAAPFIKPNKSYPVDVSEYQLIEKIGEGGNGYIYKAKCLASNETVAIKCMDLDKHKEMNFSQVAMECQTLIELKHPNILNAYCSFVVGKWLWVVMPYLWAGSLRYILKTSFPDGFEESVIATILRDIVKALSYLHKLGFIHRDVKAANILVDNDGVVKLADFGFSTFVYENGRANKRTSFVGTLCWMAPEVAFAEEVENEGYDFKADIWSLGITAIELACGDSPYTKKSTVEEIVADLRSGRVPELCGVKFSKSFKDMVRRCVREEPRERPTAEELLKHSFFKRKTKTANHIVRNVLQKIPPITKPKKMTRFERRPDEFWAQIFRYSHGWDFDDY